MSRSTRPPLTTSPATASRVFPVIRSGPLQPRPRILPHPTLSTFNPSNGAPSVAIASNLEITFSEDVAFGTGLITIRESAGGTVVESYDAANPPANLSISGSTLTIDPTALLAYSTAYYVEIDATAIDDLAGNSYVGFSGSSAWAFTTTDDPTAGLIGGGTGSGITATASTYNTGGAGFPPIQTIDGSGLTDGVHANTVGTSWLTPNTNPSEDWIQWDLGDSYVLDLIQVWNVNNNGNNGLGTKVGRHLLLECRVPRRSGRCRSRELDEARRHESDPAPGTGLKQHGL
jgi:hypothetical protein